MKIELSLETLCTALAALQSLKERYPPTDNLHAMAANALADIKRAANVTQQFEKESA